MNDSCLAGNNPAFNDALLYPFTKHGVLILKYISSWHAEYQLSLFFATDPGISFLCIARWQVMHLRPYLSYQEFSFEAGPPQIRQE